MFAHPIDDGLGGTIFAGHLHFSPVADSTNDDALTAARQGAPHGSVFFADEQLAGRGRGDHDVAASGGERERFLLVAVKLIDAARFWFIANSG